MFKNKSSLTTTVTEGKIYKNYNLILHCNFIQNFIKIQPWYFSTMRIMKTLSLGLEMRWVQNVRLRTR